MILVVYGSVLDARAETPRPTSKPCVSISDTDSHVTVRRHERIESMKDWVRLWQEHRGEKPFPYDPNDGIRRHLPVKIDFEHYLVVAIFQGKCVNVDSLKVVSITEEEKRLVLRYDKNSYQTFGKVHDDDPNDDPDKGDPDKDDLSKNDPDDGKVTPYGFFVLPRTEKPIVIEENVQQYLGSSPIWKERARLPAGNVTEAFWNALVSGDIQQMEKHYAAEVTIRKGSEFLKKVWGINPSGDQSKDLVVKREDLMKAYNRLIDRVGVEDWQKSLKSIPKKRRKAQTLDDGSILFHIDLDEDSKKTNDDVLEFKFKQNDAKTDWEVTSEFSDY
jgi:hypothetical protein